MKKNIIIILLGMIALSCNSDDDNSTIENNCDFLPEIISENDFNGINTSNYIITDVELNNGCLIITFGSSGCGTELWEENLYSTDAFYTVFPLQRALKMELINEEVCLAVFQKTVSFDLTPFQIDGQSELPLNIDGWNEQITYEY
ncbi:MAG: hypothetical protein L3J34_13070 [Flavobacteriaceae bacterium]|nr:hypothetical protein [Flavobacteriaceae bacterium]